MGGGVGESLQLRVLRLEGVDERLPLRFGAPPFRDIAGDDQPGDRPVAIRRAIDVHAHSLEQHAGAVRADHDQGGIAARAALDPLRELFPQVGRGELENVSAHHLGRRIQPEHEGGGGVGEGDPSVGVDEDGVGGEVQKARVAQLARLKSLAEPPPPIQGQEQARTEAGERTEHRDERDHRFAAGYGESQ